MAYQERITLPSPTQLIRRRRKSPAERRHITEARVALYERSEGLCELRLSPKCWARITWETMHTCHIISQARCGDWALENLKAGCPECHIGWQHNGGKPCPPKEGI
jgi:hypothetical protein